MADGILTTHIVRVQLPNWNTKMKLIPFGDVHRNCRSCDAGRWENFLERCKNDDDMFTRYIGMGDLNEFASWSGRNKMKMAGLHDTEEEKLDILAGMDEDVMHDDIEFMGDRLIGLGAGNHNWEYLTGDNQGKNITEMLCERLKCKYLGDLSYIRLILTRVGSRSKVACDIVAAHGYKAGGQLVGTSINQVDDLRKIFPMADIYLMGHDHQRFGHPTSTLFVHSGKGKLIIKQKRQWLGRSGSFRKMFTPGEPEYLVKRLKKPSELGTVRFEIKVNRDRTTVDGKKGDSLSLDIHCWS